MKKKDDHHRADECERVEIDPAGVRPAAPARKLRRRVRTGTYIVMAYTVMAYIVMAYIVMAYTVMAYIVMAYIVMAYIVMAYIVMAYIVMAYRRWHTGTTHAVMHQPVPDEVRTNTTWGWPTLRGASTTWGQHPLGPTLRGATTTWGQHYLGPRLLVFLEGLVLLWCMRRGGRFVVRAKRDVGFVFCGSAGFVVENGPQSWPWPLIVTAYIGVAYTVMACIGVAYIVMVHIVMAYMVMAYVVVACMVIAYVVMASVVMAYIVMAFIVMASAGTEHAVVHQPVPHLARRAAQQQHERREEVLEVRVLSESADPFLATVFGARRRRTPEGPDRVGGRHPKRLGEACL